MLFVSVLSELVSIPAAASCGSGFWTGGLVKDWMS
jgi:hypothetical protein